MALEAQNCVRRTHSGAVVYDLDEGAAGVCNNYVYAGCAGVYGVLHQLLNHGGGALDHLSRGNHVGDAGRKYLESSHP